MTRARTCRYFPPPLYVAFLFLSLLCRPLLALTLTHTHARTSCAACWLDYLAFSIFIFACRRGGGLRFHRPRRLGSFPTCAHSNRKCVPSLGLAPYGAYVSESVCVCVHSCVCASRCSFSASRLPGHFAAFVRALSCLCRACGLACPRAHTGLECGQSEDKTKSGARHLLHATRAGGSLTYTG